MRSTSLRRVVAALGESLAVPLGGAVVVAVPESQIMTPIHLERRTAARRP